jgi:tetratricopeptide (TPR) repeat protein
LEGRDREIEMVWDYLSAPNRGPGPRLVVVHGEPGVGKTALAIKVAHLVAEDYPDGQLLVRFDAREDGHTEDPLEMVVHALKGPKDQPPDAPDRQGWYRRRTRKQRILVMLDNVSDVDQITSLLPTGRHCVAIVTSQTALRVREPQFDVPLTPIDDEAATRLLDMLVGGGRVVDEPVYASQVVDAAAGYPVAVHMAGAVLAVRKNWTLEIAVRRMKEIGARTRGGGAAPFAGVLDLAFALLTDQERTALVLLGLLDDRRVETWMLAALFAGGFPAGDAVTQPAAGRLLDRLAGARFTERRVDDSSGVLTFRVPVYVHTYARALADQDRFLTQAQRRAARRRVDLEGQRRAEHSAEDNFRDTVYRYLDEGRLDEALNTARESLALAQQHASTRPQSTQPETTRPPSTRPQSADAAAEEGLTLAALGEVYAELGWIDEGMTCANAAKERGLTSPRTLARALRVSGTLRQRHRQLAQATSDLLDALRHVHQTDDRMEQVRVLRELASAFALSGDTTQGEQYATRARRLCEETGEQDSRHLPGVLLAYAKVLHADKKLVEASGVLSHAEKLTANPAIGQQLWRPWIRLEHALVCLDVPEYDQSRQLSLSALEGFTALRHRYGCGHARLALGRAYLGEGRIDKAIPALEESHGTFRRCGDRWIEADAAVALAAAYQRDERDGRGREAIDLLSAAEQAFATLGDTESLHRASHLLWTVESTLPAEPLLQRPVPRQRAAAVAQPRLVSTAPRPVTWPVP